ncbi:MAG: DUF2231 domain-containing protein [Polyangiaceae bacterium]
MDLLHPKIVHFPIALAVLIPVLAAVVWAAWRRELLPRRAWWLVVGAQLFLVASGFIAMRSGESDEERAERVVPESAIEVHEEAAKVFMAGAFVVLLLAGGTLLLKKERAAQTVAAVSALGMLGVLGLGYRVGQAGGALVYEHGAASAVSKAGSAAMPAAEAGEGRGGKHDDDDDDD